MIVHPSAFVKSAQRAAGPVAGTRQVFRGWLPADGSLTWDRSDDTDAESCQTQGDVIFQILDLRNTYAFCRLDFVECDGRTNRSTDGFDLYSKVAHIALGAAVVFGMALNTLLATVYIPNFYELMQKLQEKFSKKQ